MAIQISVSVELMSRSVCSQDVRVIVVVLRFMGLREISLALDELGVYERARLLFRALGGEDAVGRQASKEAGNTEFERPRNARRGFIPYTPTAPPPEMNSMGRHDGRGNEEDEDEKRKGQL